MGAFCLDVHCHPIAKSFNLNYSPSSWDCWRVICGSRLLSVRGVRLLLPSFLCPSSPEAWGRKHGVSARSFPAAGRCLLARPDNYHFTEVHFGHEQISDSRIKIQHRIQYPPSSVDYKLYLSLFYFLNFYFRFKSFSKELQIKWCTI